MKKINWAWGAFFIFAGAMLILNQTDLLKGIGFWSLLLTLLLVPIFVQGIVHRNFPEILFPIAFWAIIYANPLGIQKFTPYPVLGCALFLSFGLSIIFPNKKFAHKYYKGERMDNSDNWISESLDGECIKISTRFSGATKYVNSQDFKSCEINCSFGGMKVYFDNAVMQGNESRIMIYSDFSGVELFIPKDWTADIAVDCRLGGVDEKGNIGAEKSGKIVHIGGNISFAGLTIRYV